MPPDPTKQYNGFYYLLRGTELERLANYRASWVQKFGLLPEDDPDCLFHLGDNALVYPVWTANGKFPSFRRSMSLLWHPASQTVLLPKERLCLLGWPLYPALATAAGVPVFEFPDLARANRYAGNAYHVAVLGSWLTTCLACVQLTAE